MWLLWVFLGVVGLLLWQAFQLFRTALGEDRVSTREKAFASWEKRFGIDTGSLGENLDWFYAQPLQTLTTRSHDNLLLTADYLPAQGIRRGRIILMHGYHSGPWDFCGAIRWYSEMGFDLLIPDQRAHGRSEGAYCGFGVLERKDCCAWAEEANRRFGETVPTLLSGISMGASTVLMAAGEPLPPNVKGVIADCGFTSPEDILLYELDHLLHLPKYPLYPLVAFWTRLLAGYGLREYSTIAAMECCCLPVLFVHGAADDFVPAEMTQRTWEACKSEKELLLVPEAGHGMSYLLDKQGYQEALFRLFRRCGMMDETI